MPPILLTALFGAVGVLCRYALDRYFALALIPHFPASTLSINVVGSFAIGVVFVLGTERAMLTPETALAISVGFLGGFTTFSAFSLQVIQLIERKQITMAVAYAVGSPILGISAAFAGVKLGRYF